MPYAAAQGMPLISNLLPDTKLLDEYVSMATANTQYLDSWLIQMLFLNISGTKILKYKK